MDEQTTVYLATLSPGKIDRYRELHDQIPEQIERHLREDGIVSLEIYLTDDKAIMVVRRNPSHAEPHRNFDEKLEQWWQQETGQCFESFWQASPLIYSLDSEGERNE
jgi:L-rhamnose mutarotase